MSVFANNLRNFITDSVSIARVSISATLAISAADLRPFFGAAAAAVAVAGPAPARAPLRLTSCITASSCEIPTLDACVRA